MNKKLVAVAVAGLLAAPLAAQAQTANVTLYGRLNLDMEVVSAKLNLAPCVVATGVGCTTPNQYRVSSNSSRFGMRGVESLGGGLNAIFQIESNVQGDTGGSTLATRETYAGLQGSWGTFKLGNFLAPYDDIHPIFGNVPTLTTSILSTASLWAQGYASKDSGGFDARLGNSIRYDTPTLSGFNASLQIAAKDASCGTNQVVGVGCAGNPVQSARHAYVLSTGAFYNNGPLQLGFGYEANNKVRGPNLNDWAMSIAGGYQFTNFRIGAVYERLDYDTPTGSLTRNMYGVGATVNAGPGQMYLYWGQSGNGSGTSVNGTTVAGLTKGDNTGADQWEVSYTYPLSKRTLMYTGYVKLNNKNYAGYNFNINSVDAMYVAPYGSGQQSAKPGGFVMGLVHLF